MAEDRAIRVRNLAHAVGPRAILHDIDLDLDAPRIGIIGRNGSGKSTLARLLAGLVRPTRGQVTVGGCDVAADRRGALAQVGILFQNPEHQIIFPTVLDEIAFGPRQAGLGRPQARAAAEAILARFGKAHWRDAATATLSQGQKHLLCLMAVMAVGPRWLVLDEPLAGLDIPTRMQLGRYLDSCGARLIHISHEPRDLAGYDRILWLDDGRVRAQGGAELLERFERCMIREGMGDDLADLAG